MRNRLISAIMLATMVAPLATTAAEARRDDRGERHERNDRRGGDHRNDRHDDRRGGHRNEGNIRQERAPGSRTEVSGRNGGNYQVRNEYVRSRDDDRREYRREYRDDRRNYNRGYRQGYRNGHDDRSSWNRDWRNDPRYDWRHHRDRYRHHYNLGRYFPPVRHHRHNRISIGFYIGAPFYHGRYWIGNPGYYHLPPAYGPYRWVRYYDDILLVNVRNGYVVDVIYDFFW